MIEYRAFDSFKSINKIDLAKAFQSIYSVSPWNEWKECSSQNCKCYWGKKDEQLLNKMNYNHCNMPIQDYWRLEFLLKNYNSIEKKKGFKLVIAYDYLIERIVGFCWGYILNSNDFKVKFRTNKSSNSFDEFLYLNKDAVYLSEIAVIEGYRRKGVAKNLFNIYINFYMKNIWIITKTKGGENPSLSNLWFKKLGFFTAISFDKNLIEIQYVKIKSLT